MRILFVADGRSPTAINWISFFVEQGHEVHLASTYSCSPDLKLASLTITPVAFSSAAGEGGGKKSGGLIRRLTTSSMRTKIRQILGPATISRAAANLKTLITDLQPDLVHAMRIPYEGMLAAAALEDSKIPFLVSVWGNDFTLHASSNPFLLSLTRRTLQRVDALHTDTQRDQKLALQFGYSDNKPSIVLPGGGGIRTEIFYPPSSPLSDLVIINPRGIRSYIRNDTFFKSIPRVLEELPNAKFICPAMLGEKEAEQWVNKLNIASSVKLLPLQSRKQMAELYRSAQIAVSISEHDGTPNTLLEAMACGCFPIAGDIESLREWINPPQNGLLVPYDDPEVLALAILKAFDDKSEVVKYNSDMISERASFNITMAAAETLYGEIV